MGNKEIWKKVVGYEDEYEISSLGRLRNLKTKKQKCVSIDKDGYLRTTLCKNGKQKTMSIHRLVAQAFIPNSNKLPCINHKNEIKSDNRTENLEWCDIRYNNRYSKAKKVLQFDLNGKFIKEWDAVRDIVRELNYNIESIIGCCNKKYKTSYGFIWRYKNMSKNFELCYVHKNKAYFTNDFEHCWGDDFDDIPYEHNAGLPYDYWSELIEDNEDIFKRKYIHHPIELKELFYEFPCEWVSLPCDNYTNSPFSVEMINKGAIAWIIGNDFIIPAKTEYEDFIKIVQSNKGIVYVPLSKNKEEI